MAIVLYALINTVNGKQYIGQNEEYVNARMSGLRTYLSDPKYVQLRSDAAKRAWETRRARAA